MRYRKASAAILSALMIFSGFTVHAEPYTGGEAPSPVEIYVYLKEYADSMQLDVGNIFCVYRDGGEKVCVEVYGIMSDSEEQLRRYIREMNIDENRVEFVWLSRVPDEQEVLGDANSDGKVTVRDCAYIAGCLSRGRANMLPGCADYNGDGKINVRDAAAISKDLANKQE